MNRPEPSLVERVFLLNNTPPFDLLEDQELMNIADTLTTGYVPEGEQVISAGSPVNNLFIVSEGYVINSKESTSLKILGVKALLQGTAADETVRAGNGGAILLKLGKDHFFTTVYECSGLLPALMKLLNQPEPYFN